MVEHNRGATLLDDTFAAIAHPTRRELLEALSDGPARITDLAEPFDVSLAAVSKHVQVLEQASLVRRSVHGREHIVHVSPDPLAAAEDWLASYRTFWETRLDALEAHLRERLDD
jgi:DNA-binding transcriptional ArsR family regulator